MHILTDKLLTLSLKPLLIDILKSVCYTSITRAQKGEKSAKNGVNCGKI